MYSPEAVVPASNMSWQELCNSTFFFASNDKAYKILNPIDQALRYVDINMEDDGLKQYIKSTYGSAEKAKITVLCDFFKGAFDERLFHYGRVL